MSKQWGGSRPGSGRPSREGQYERITVDVRKDLLDFVDNEMFGSRREVIEKALLDLKAEQENKKMAAMTALSATLEKFLESDDFKSGVISSTKASWGGSSDSVEILPDGTWQVLWNSQIGNRYETPGKILGLPVLDTDDMAAYVDGGAGSEDDFLSEGFDLVEDELKAEMREKLQS